MLGYFQQVKSATPLEVNLKGTSSSTTVNSVEANIQEQSVYEVSCNSCQEWSKGEEESNTSENSYNHIPDVDIERLSEEQRTIERKMLEEESESFSKMDDDVGATEELQVEINLTDSTPVQKKHISIPRPLYAEVKQYVEDLLNRGWIQKSMSAYSSPVVCV